MMIVLSTSFRKSFLFFFFFFFFLLLLLLFLLGALHRRRKTNFCHDLTQNHVSYNLCTNSFILVNQNFLIFPVKMNANYSEICRSGNLEADLNFSEIFTIFL